MYRYMVYPDELLHYGVKGMKWGVRRYQNYDGTRIGTGGDPVIRKGKAVSKAYKNSIAGGQGGKATGIARLAASAGGAKKNKNKPDKQGALDQTIPNGKGKPNVSPAEKLARDSSNLATGGKELTRAIRDVDPRLKQKKEKAQNKQLNKAKKMSDQELRDSINRIKMEREYASLTTKETKSGYDKAMEIMEISGKVLFVVATALSIASTVKKLKMSHGLDTSEEEKALYTFLKNNDAPEDILIHAQALDTDYLENWLEHHGVKGMKWGVRRYQNYDGTRIKGGTPGLPSPSSLGNGGVGSGAGGGGGGSSKKASLSSTFKRSIAGGQGGKAEGTARLAAKAPSFKEAIQKRKAINEVRNDKSLSDLQKDTVSALIEGKDDPHTIIKNALDKTDVSSILDAKKNLQDTSSKVDWDKVTKDEIEYDLSFINKAVDEIELKHPDIYEQIVNDCKNENFDIVEHKLVNMYAFNMEDYDPSNRPNKTSEEKASDKAAEVYVNELYKGFEKIVGSKPYSNKTYGQANLDSYWDYYNDVINDLDKRR